jgi:hypothetical protein
MTKIHRSPSHRSHQQCSRRPTRTYIRSLTNRHSALVPLCTCRSHEQAAHTRCCQIAAEAIAWRTCTCIARLVSLSAVVFRVQASWGTRLDQIASSRVSLRRARVQSVCQVLRHAALCGTTIRRTTLLVRTLERNTHDRRLHMGCPGGERAAETWRRRKRNRLYREAVSSGRHHSSLARVRRR